MSCNNCPRVEALEKEVATLKAQQIEHLEWTKASVLDLVDLSEVDSQVVEHQEKQILKVQERLDKLEAHIDEPGCVQWIDRVNKSITELRTDLEEFKAVDRHSEHYAIAGELAQKFKSCDCGDNWVAYNDHFKRYGGNIDELFKKLEAMEISMRGQVDFIRSCPAYSYNLNDRLTNIEGLMNLLRNVQKED